MPRYVGVDVSRDTLEVAWAAEGGTRRFPNPEGIEELVEALKAAGACQVVLEPTSTFHHRLVQALVGATIPYTAVNPAHTAGYARARGSRSKTDPADARLLARYGDRETPDPSHPPDEAQERLKALRRHLEWLQTDLQAVRNRLDAAQRSPWTPRSVVTSLEQGIRQREAEVAQAQAELDAAVAQDERWTHQVELLTTIPGIGQRTAVLVVSELPPVERCAGPKQWVAFCGLNPEEHQSGQSSWTALSRKGSPRVRARLYLAGVAALRWNQPIKALGERLKARGKHGKLRAVAAMSKLLHQCFAILRSGRPFNASMYGQKSLDYQYGI